MVSKWNLLRSDISLLASLKLIDCTPATECRSSCGNNTWCTDWSSNSSIDCSCIDSTYFSTNDDGSNCLPCLQSCPAWSLKKLKEAVIYLSVLAGVTLLLMVAILATMCLMRMAYRVSQKAQAQIAQSTQALLSKQQEISSVKPELLNKQQRLVLSRETTLTLRAKIDQLRFENGQLVASGISMRSCLNLLHENTTLNLQNLWQWVSMSQRVSFQSWLMPRSLGSWKNRVFDALLARSLYHDWLSRPKVQSKSKCVSLLCFLYWVVLRPRVNLRRSNVYYFLVENFDFKDEQGSSVRGIAQLRT